MINNVLLNGGGQQMLADEAKINVIPKTVFSIFGINISETLVIAWAVMILLILAAVIIRVFVIRRFKTVPNGIQNILEMFVESSEKFTQSNIGKRAKWFASYVFAIAIMIVATSLAELFGFRPPVTDINFTIAIAAMSFVLINAFGVYYTGIFGRVKWFFKPMPFMFPINIATHAVIPVSLSFRLFGNMFAGMVVMDLLYSVTYLSIGIPAVLAIYFNLFHVGIQVYIFLVLTLSFMEETVAYGTKR
jgi:F-type H+-transporting ATPase subunit a